MNKFLIPFLITFFSGISTVVGSLFIYLKPKNINNFIGFSLAFSGSIMFFISLFELIPEGFFGLSNEFNIFVAIIILLLMLYLGNLLIKLINRYIKEDSNNLYRVGVLSMIGLMIHNMPEGILTFLSSTLNISIGIKYGVAIMFHNIPEGIAISVPLYYGTGKRSKAIVYTLISGFSEVFGALIAYVFLYRFLSNTLISIILLFVSGIMISISFNEIYKEIEKYSKRSVILGSIFGLIVVLITEFAF